MTQLFLLSKYGNQFLETESIRADYRNAALTF